MAQPQYFYLQGAGLSIGNPQGNIIGPESSIINTEQMTLPSLSSVSTKRRADVENRIETSPKRQRTEDAVSLGDNLSDIEERIDGLLSPQKVDKNNNIVEEDGDSDFESVLKQISDEINDEDKGLPISDSLAKCMTDIWEKPLSKEKYLEKLKNIRYHRM